MDILDILYKSFYINYKILCLCFKTIWYCSYLCSFQGLFFLCLLSLFYNYSIQTIDSYMNPFYDYFEITESIPTRKDTIVYISCSLVDCNQPSIYISQMIIGWKPINQTFILKYLDIDIVKLTQTFGESVGRGMICGLKSDAQSYFKNFFTNVQTLIPIHYIDNK